MYVILVGCGAQLGAREPAQDALLLDAGPGPRLLVLPRGSAELLRVSLWIDAGSRDADPPQGATVAAWLAADAAGRTAEPTVFPDATEIAVLCAKPQLEACLERLARVLQQRTVSAEALARAVGRLAQTRRKADDRDPGADADRLALRALYGDAASALFPLGEAERDGQLDADAIGSLLARHYAPARALLVIVGDVAADRALSAVQASFSRLPPAQQRRAANRPHVQQSGVALEIDNRPALSIAVGAADLSRARAAAELLGDQLERTGVARTLHAYTFQLRGGSIALLRVQAPEPLAVIAGAAQLLQRWRSEGLEATPQRTTAQDAVARSRRAGLRWATDAAGRIAMQERGEAQAAGATQPAGKPADAAGDADAASADAAAIPPHPAPASRDNGDLFMGVGVLVAGGRVDRVQSGDPDALQRESWQRRAAEAWETFTAESEAAGRGDHDVHGASLELDNGARVEVRRSGGEQAAIAIRFACGGRCDPPQLHGRAALLATLTTTACAGMSPLQLDERVRSIGAELIPRVDAESWGVLLTTPAAQWREGLALGLECALHPTLKRAELSDARLRLRERMGPRGGSAELSARVAQVVAPSAPGMIAPWGDVVRHNSISLNLLRELWEAYRSGSSISVSLVGPVDVEDAQGRITRRLAGLARGRPLQPARLERAGAGHGTGEASERAFGVALWRVPGDGADAAGARGFAALMRALLGATPGLQASWHDGGADRELGAWAAVAISGPPTALAERIETLKRSAASAGTERVQAVADRALELERRQQAELSGSPAVEAESLARGRFATPPTSSQDGARRVALSLASANPIWLPLQ